MSRFRRILEETRKAIEEENASPAVVNGIPVCCGSLETCEQCELRKLKRAFSVDCEIAFLKWLLEQEEKEDDAHVMFECNRERCETCTPGCVYTTDVEVAKKLFCDWQRRVHGRRCDPASGCKNGIPGIHPKRIPHTERRGTMIDEKELIERLKQWRESLEPASKHDLIRDVLDTVMDIAINEVSRTGGWIPAAERLPEERNSMFTEFKGTRRWTNAMFEKISNTVMATVVLENGARTVEPAHTVDGKWKMEDTAVIKKKVIAWMPLPEPYMEEKLWVD